MAKLLHDDQQEGILRSISGTPPTHYTVKIQSFSLLTKNNIEKYDTSEFEAGGYKWQLVLHPNGNKNKNVSDHISVYMVMAEVSSRRQGWEVHAVFRLFLLDQNNDNYLTLEDTTRKGRHFHRMKLEWGFDRFISLQAFNDASNGYLVDDTCVFGAEIFVCKERSRGKAECLSMIKDAISYKHTWKIDNFSKLGAECNDSKAFRAGNQKWKIQIYPNGRGIGMGSHISLYVVWADPESLPHGSKIYAEFTLRILDQINDKPFFGKANHWFSAASQEAGWPRFISFGYFTHQKLGFLTRDSCWVEAEVTIHGVANALE